MKTLLALALFLVLPLAAPAAEWSTDYSAAMAKAKAENKMLLLDFTGSDWCPSCIHLEREVLSQPDFASFADKNYVLVKVDFPQGKELPAAVQKQNDGLAHQFGVEGFPTLLVVSAEGKELGRQVGYAPGSGPNAVLGQLKGFKK